MKRILYYTITEKYQNITILNFLKQQGYTSKAISHLKRTEQGIVKNGSWAYVNEPLSLGDTLTITIIETEQSANIVARKLDFEIVYEDEDIIIVNKPFDMPIHPSQNNYDNALANGLMHYFKEQNKDFVFRCINRLDRNTTGLTIIAKHQLAGGILSNMVSKREIKRHYYAICQDRGTLKNTGTIEASIARKEGSTIERIVDPNLGEFARTHYEKILWNPNHNASLIKLNLDTGRTHQIRVHMKHIGHPLVGDSLYGIALPYMTRQALHSFSLEFIHPILQTPMYFEADLPVDMQWIKQS